MQVKDDLQTRWWNLEAKLVERFGKKPDLALLDIQLPGKNGMDLLKGIKDSTKECEVVMLTNSAGEYYREQCRKLGALRFFDKTNDFELVPAMIKDFAIQNNNKTGVAPKNS